MENQDVIMLCLLITSFLVHNHNIFLFPHQVKAQGLQVLSPPLPHHRRPLPPPDPKLSCRATCSQRRPRLVTWREARQCAGSLTGTGLSMAHSRSGEKLATSSGLEHRVSGKLSVSYEEFTYSLMFQRSICFHHIFPPLSLFYCFIF